MGSNLFDRHDCQIALKIQDGIVEISHQISLLHLKDCGEFKNMLRSFYKFSASIDDFTDKLFS